MKKFYGVIGNPPYQDKAIGDNATYTPPIYHHFIDECYEISEKTELITPAKFLFNAGKTPKAWNRKMLQDPHLKVLLYEADEKKIFPAADISGGVAVTYHDPEASYGAIEIFSQFPEINTIRVKAISSSEYQSFSDIVISAYAYRFTEKMHQDYPEAASQLSKGHAYDLKSNVLGSLPQIFSDNKPNDEADYVRIAGRVDGERVIKWMKLEYLSFPENFKAYKLIMGRAHGAAGMLGNPIPAGIIGLPTVTEPYVGTTESFLTIGSFVSSFEAENALSYLKTKFSRALIGILKATQDITPEKFKYVPLQDFTSNSDIDWSKSVAEIDKQLYKKYGLDENEIAFIESHVKEMR